jgi:hypothetical protein
MLRCEADCEGSAYWVAAALAQIARVPLGAELVEGLLRPPYRLRPWQGWHWLTDRVTGRSREPGRVREWLPPAAWAAPPPPKARPLSVIFTPHLPWLSSKGNLAMVTRPWAIYVRSSYIEPDIPPSPPVILIFAHELVHVQQGPLLAASIMGELLAYHMQALLRPHLAPGYPPNSGEQDAVTVAGQLDLANWRALRREKHGRQQLRQHLHWWRERHPAYRHVPLEPLWVR